MLFCTGRQLKHIKRRMKEFLIAIERLTPISTLVVSIELVVIILEIRILTLTLSSSVFSLEMQTHI